ncbi:hypothetical protein IWQ60_005123 [Tieghemiomyces parasiticus]|uniref:diacylglycerol O-acyltransferase n=1 Tax=Tieghemiomyces parasiticus TaxID=78921 RepID=A0A9W8A7K5_9FUNG|nr:hypothetical protein IWQ60_005123 [Tieghemiomyces parasiticus]
MSVQSEPPVPRPPGTDDTDYSGRSSATSSPSSSSSSTTMADMVTKSSPSDSHLAPVHTSRDNHSASPTPPASKETSAGVPTAARFTWNDDSLAAATSLRHRGSAPLIPTRSTTSDSLAAATSALAPQLELLEAHPPSEYYESDVSTNTVPIQATAEDANARHTLPVHTEVRSSVLSYGENKVSYKGFLNLALLLLFVTNVRLVVENYMKYGLLMSIPGRLIPAHEWIFTVVASALLPLNLLATYGIEQIVAQQYAWPLVRSFQRYGNGANVNTAAPGRPSSGSVHPAKSAAPGPRVNAATYRWWTLVSGWAHALNLTIALAYPCYIVYTRMNHPFLGMCVLATVLVQELKLISYVLVNRSLRYNLAHGLPQPAEYTVRYPANITPHNSLYFAMVPTLCYQPSYPRNQRFRKRFFLKRCLEGSIAVVMIYFLIEQYAIPTLKNSVGAWEELNVMQILERVFKLSTTSVIVWLLGFYAIFHAYLNALAEVLHFGDRSFYLPWWNSGTLARYWRLWNQPVHFFFKRHVYLPCLRAGLPPFGAMVLIFFISALLHEVLVAIPTHNLSGHAFWGIFFQVPLVLFTDLVAQHLGKDSSVGNIFFWISFCILGQPFLIVRYFYDWSKMNLAA